MVKEGYNSNIIPAKFIRVTLVPAWAFDIPQACSFRKLFSCHSRSFLFLLTITLLLSVSFSAWARKTLKIELTTEEQTSKERTINLTAEMLVDLPGELLQELRETTLALNREAALEVIAHIADQAPDVATGLKELVDNYQMDQLRDLLG